MVPKNYVARWNLKARFRILHKSRVQRTTVRPPFQWSTMMQHESKKTTDHDTIRRWVEARGGRPAAVAETHEGDEVGVIRIAFAPAGDETEGLEEITWEEFFEKFEEKNLAFLHQEQTKDGGTSRFFKFVTR
jgi:hypothetical protein